MRTSMIALAGLCVLMGLGAIWMLKLVLPVAEQFLPQRMHQVSLDTPQTALLRITIVALVLIATGADDHGHTQVVALETFRTRRRNMGLRLCRSHFSHAVHGIFVCRANHQHVQGHSQAEGFGESGLTVSFRPKQVCIHIPDDPFMNRVFKPAFEAIAWIAGGVRRVKTGQMHHYVLYIALTILALLIWRLG